MLRDRATVLINTFVLIKQYCTIVQYVLHDRAINVARSCNRCTNGQFEQKVFAWSCNELQQHSIFPVLPYVTACSPLRLPENLSISNDDWAIFDWINLHVSIARIDWLSSRATQLLHKLFLSEWRSPIVFVLLPWESVAQLVNIDHTFVQYLHATIASSCNCVAQ